MQSQKFARDSVLTTVALALFLRDGREVDSAEYSDTDFASQYAFLTAASEDDQERKFTPIASPYLALVFERLGRVENAAAHIASLERHVERGHRIVFCSDL